MKHVLLLLAASSALLAHAQPNTQWLRTAGGFSQFDPYRSAADVTGHVYTAGLGTATDFGNGVSVPGEGRVIARYDSSGTILWARALTTTPNETASISGIATDSQGSLWVTGYFLSATLTLDGFVLNNGSFATSAFLARIGPTGTVEYATAWGLADSTITTAMDIHVDALDNVLITGHTDAPSLVVEGIAMTNTSGGEQLYAIKLDVFTGQWGVMSTAPQGASRGLCISADAGGNTYVVGRTTGAFVVDEDTVDAGASIRAVLLKIDPTGALVQMHALAECQPQDLDVDDAGNAYVAGWIESTAIFNSDTLVPSVLDGFVAAYDSDGNYRWVVGVQGEIDNEICWSVDLDAAGSGLYVGGTFVFDAWFGDLHVETGLSPTDGFVMQVDTAGTVNWVKDMTGDGPTLFAEACLDPWDHLYASGVTQSQMSYLGEPVLNGSGNHAFLARFHDFSTGLPSSEGTGGLSLHPNPCEGRFTLELPWEARTVIIEDAQGRVHQRVSVLGSGRSSFQIGTPGIYSVTVLSDAGRAVERIVVE